MRFDGPQNVKAQPRVQIREGMTVAEVRQYGSEGQKLAASLFDNERVEGAEGYVKDGIFTEGEAQRFNNYNFAVRDGIFTMYDRKSGQTTEIKYDNVDDLKNLLNDNLNEPGSMIMRDKNGKTTMHLGESTQGGKITLDLTNKTITADGVKGEYIYASGDKVTVKNSDVGTIGSHGKELEVKNTKDEGIIYDSATKLEVGKNTKVKIDDASKVEIVRDDE